MDEMHVQYIIAVVDGSFHGGGDQADRRGGHYGSVDNLDGIKLHERCTEVNMLCIHPIDYATHLMVDGKSLNTTIYFEIETHLELKERRIN